jgi:hypothetical protein
MHAHARTQTFTLTHNTHAHTTSLLWEERAHDRSWDRKLKAMPPGAIMQEHPLTPDET